MSQKPPTIKGVFVKTHVHAIRKEFGDAGVDQLEKSFGKPLRFKNSDPVPIADEVRILEYYARLKAKKDLSQYELDRFAGELHFQNFLATPLGRIVFSFFGEHSSVALMRSKYLTRHIFSEMIFEAEDAEPGLITVIVRNSDYPRDHFCGFLQAWLGYIKRTGVVSVATIAPRSYHYTVRFQNSLDIEQAHEKKEQ